MHVPSAEETHRREPTNADIMSRLDTIVTKMIINDDPNELKIDITEDTQLRIAEVVDPLKAEVHDLKMKMETEATKVAAEAKTVVEELEHKMQQVQFAGGLVGTTTAMTTVFGDFNGGTMSSAEDWITWKVRELSLAHP